MGWQVQTETMLLDTDDRATYELVKVLAKSLFISFALMTEDGTPYLVIRHHHKSDHLDFTDARVALSVLFETGGLPNLLADMNSGLEQVEEFERNLGDAADRVM